MLISQLLFSTLNVDLMVATISVNIYNLPLNVHVQSVRIRYFFKLPVVKYIVSHCQILTPRRAQFLIIEGDNMVFLLILLCISHSTKLHETHYYTSHIYTPSLKYETRPLFVCFDVSYRISQKNIYHDIIFYSHFAFFVSLLFLF